jgi:hypothetical protein
MEKQDIYHTNNKNNNMKKITISKKTWSTFWTIIGLILFSFALWGLSGCMTPSKINRIKQQYCRDSVSIQIKDRIVKVPIYYADSSMLEIFMQCDSIGNIYYTNWKQSEGKYSDLQAALKDNVLTVKNYVTIYDTAHVTVTDTVKFQQANSVTNILTNGQQLRQTIFWCFLVEHILLFLITIVYTFFKFKTGIINFFKPK